MLSQCDEPRAGVWVDDHRLSVRPDELHALDAARPDPEHELLPVGVPDGVPERRRSGTSIAGRAQLAGGGSHAVPGAAREALEEQQLDASRHAAHDRGRLGIELYDVLRLEPELVDGRLECHRPRGGRRGRLPRYRLQDPAATRKRYEGHR